MDSSKNGGWIIPFSKQFIVASMTALHPIIHLVGYNKLTVIKVD